MKRRSLFLILIFIFLEPSQARLKTPLVKSSKVSQVSYLAFLQAHSKYISVEEHLMKKHPLKKNKDRLFKLFLEAQKSYLEKSSRDSAEKFKKILELQFLDDWNLPQRKIISYALLRLSQLEKESSTTWIQKAISFDSELPPDPQLFPPETQKAWNDIQEKMSTLTLSPLGRGFSLLRVNGKVLRDEKSLKLFEGFFYRFHLISNEFQPIVSVQTSEDMKEKRHRRIPLVKGGCQSSSFTSPFRKALFSNQCINGRRKPKALSPLPKKTQKQKISQKNFISHPGLWIAGTLLGVFLYRSLEKKTPSYGKGF